MGPHRLVVERTSQRSQRFGLGTQQVGIALATRRFEQHPLPVHISPKQVGKVACEWGAIDGVTPCAAFDNKARRLTIASARNLLLGNL